RHVLALLIDPLAIAQAALRGLIDWFDDDIARRGSGRSRDGHGYAMANGVIHQFVEVDASCERAALDRGQVLARLDPSERRRTEWNDGGDPQFAGALVLRAIEIHGKAAERRLRRLR